MSIFVAGTEITDIKIGSTEINEVYVGANKVWERATTYTLTNDAYYVQMNFSGPSWHKYDYEGFSAVDITYKNNQGDLDDSALSPTAFTLSSYTGTDPDIEGLYFRRWRTSAGDDEKHLVFRLDKAASNDGWTTLQIDIGGGTVFSYNRADASSFSAATKATWEWTITSNPFTNPSVGSNVTVKFI